MMPRPHLLGGIISSQVGTLYWTNQGSKILMLSPFRQLGQTFGFAQIKMDIFRQLGRMERADCSIGIIQGGMKPKPI
jgi:hypothetical protein